MPLVKIGSEAEFKSQLQSAGAAKLVVVDFFADWCGPCKQIAPKFAELSEKYKAKAVFLKVDADEQKELAGSLGVRALPTFLFYHKSALLEKMEGAHAETLEQKVEALVQKHAHNPFSGKGFVLGSSSGAPSGAPSSSSSSSSSSSGSKPTTGQQAPSTQGAAPARRNPWADPNFVPPGLRKESKEPTTTASTAPTEKKDAPKPKANTPWSDPNFKPPAPSAAPTESAPSAPSKPVVAAGSNDSRLQVNAALKDTLLAMGFPSVRAEKALIFTKNKSAEDALNWLVAHETDPDIDEPLQVVSAAPSTSAAAPSSSSSSSSSSSAPPSSSDAPATSTAKPAAPMDVDPELAPPPKDAPSMADDVAEMDEEMRKIVEASKKAKSAGVPVAAEDAPPKKPMSEMTSEEKQAWLLERREQVKKKREQEAIEKAKSSEKSRQSVGKAALDLQRIREEEMMKRAYAEKQKQEAASRAHRKEIQAKIAADKERRKREREAELAALEKAKAEKAAAAKK